MELSSIRAPRGIRLSPYKRGFVWHVDIRRGSTERCRVSTRETTAGGAMLFIEHLAARISKGFDPFERVAPQRSLAAHVAEWLERQTKRLDPATMESYRSAARALVVELGDKLPEHVTRAHARDLVALNRTNAAGYKRSRKTLGNHIAIWHAFFADWIDLARDETTALRANPFDRPSRLLDAGAPEPRRRLQEDEDGEPKPFSREQSERIRNAASLAGATVQCAILLGLHAGLRNSEVLGLRVCDVDLEQGLIRVRQRLSRGKIGPVKSARSRRDVPMTKSLETALRTLLASSQSESEARPTCSPVFGSVSRPQEGGLTRSGPKIGVALRCS